MHTAVAAEPGSSCSASARGAVDADGRGGTIARIDGGHQDWGSGHAGEALCNRPPRPYRRGVGEHRPIRILRAVGVATLVVAAVTVLSSCSQSGGAPGGAGATTVSPAATPTGAVPTPTETIASDTPAPVATPVATNAPTASSDARTAVVPFITTADWDASAKALDVSAIVPGVVEGGGTCTVTLTSGSTTRTATSSGVAAASYTGCEAVAVQDLAAGTWQVQVRYSSAKAVGTSKIRSAQVG